jgi:hypothetical protein
MEAAAASVDDKARPFVEAQRKLVQQRIEELKKP